MHAKKINAEFNVTSLFAEALATHRAGRLAEAEKIYEKILAIQPDHFDSLHSLGFIYYQRGSHEEAIHKIDLALRRNPNNSAALNNRGVILKELQQFDKALASYDRALTMRPDYAEAHSNRGVVLYELKRFEEALLSYDRALKLRPDYAEALSNRGNTLKELKRFEEALACYNRALILQPKLAEALSNRGFALHELKRFEEALASYDQALTLRPDYAEALSNRGATLHELKRFEEALASCDRALMLRPDYAEALSNRGDTLHELKRFEEALASCERAVKLRPDYAEGFSNRGNALRGLKRFEEALASYDRALTLRPVFAEGLSNRGVTLHELKRFDEALASYDRALTLRPDFADGHLNEAVTRLLTGDFDRGWEKNEWRWKSEQLKIGERNFAQPQWTGSNEIRNKTILLHAEQGFGDTIQFCRYVPRVVARAGRVILEVPKPLHALMSTIPGLAQIVSKGDPLPDFDMHCPLLSLPLAFGTRLETILAETPYLHASPSAAMNWDARLGPRSRPRIGLAWSGRPAHKNDHNRSIRLSALLPLLDVDATYISLQRDVRAGDATVLQQRGEILHFGAELKTFSDTAALMSNLDLIIAVDTSVAHLAGALAKPIWILLPFVPDWRWLLDRDDSPWYPTARLFRQDDTREWDNVIARLHVALRDYVHSL
jgi:tetratricopeptide (TPR) repeat protein